MGVEILEGWASSDDGLEGVPVGAVVSLLVLRLAGVTLLVYAEEFGECDP